MASINISSFAGAGAQFFDNNGTPLVGGLLYVYTAGTTTPVTTYTNPSGTVNNTNPIVLDAGGRTPEQIFVNGGVLYKFILKNSANVTIGTYDNIPAIDDPTTFNNLITVTGTNALIGTSTPPNTAYAAGMTLSFVVANTNTGPVTIDVDGLGAKEITVQTTTLIAGQLNAGGIAAIEYDGTRFQLMNVSGATTFTTVTATNLRVTNITDIAGGNTAQINGMTPTAQSLQGFRNRIINGDMRIDQRNAGVQVTPTTSSYTIDRWQLQITQASKLSIQQVTSQANGPVGFPNYLGAISTSSYSVLSSDFFALTQKIEAFNVSDLAWGTASAQAVTLSFRVWCTLTGTFGGSITNSAGNRSYPFTYSIPVASAWTNISITIPGDVSGTWTVASNATGLILYIGLGSGSTFSGTAGAWAAGNFVTTTGATSVVGTNNATLYVTGVQLEAGSVATPFERRDYGRELIMCQRYFEVGGNPHLWSGVSVFGGIYYTTVRFVVTKRGAPTVTPTEIGSSGFSTTAPNITNVVTDAFLASKTSNSAQNAGFFQFSWVASAEL